MLLIALTFPLACSGESPEPTDDDTGAAVLPECTVDETCQAWEICNADGYCEDGDHNNSQDDAVGLLWEDARGGWLLSGDDVDWYSFVSEGEEWVRLQTVCEDADTLLELYSPVGKLHASEDNHPLGSVSTYDSVMMAYLHEPGEWLLKVSHGAEGGETASYSVEVLPFSAVTSETDSRSTPSMELTLSDSNINNLGVVLEETGDSDWIRYSVPAGASMYIAGSSSPRDSDLDLVVELMLPDGTPLLYKQSPTTADRAVHLRLEGGEVVMRVSDAQGGGSAKHWATLHSYQVHWFDDYQVEVEPNDSGSDTPLPIEWDQDDSGRDRGISQAMGALDSDGDVDRFALEIEQGNYLYINGSTNGYGSLLSDSNVRVLDDQGQVLSEGELDPDGDSFADVPYFGPLDQGTYTIEVSSTSAAGGPGSYYLFSAFQKNFDE